MFGCAAESGCGAVTLGSVYLGSWIPSATHRPLPACSDPEILRAKSFAELYINRGVWPRGSPNRKIVGSTKKAGGYSSLLPH
jgi:hypothetical protein